MERWSTIIQDDVELARIRIYDDKSRGVHAVPRMFVEVPATDGSGAPDVYELDMQNQDVENQVVVAERLKDPSAPASRARTTIMTGKVKHECNLRPVFSDRYRERIRSATVAAEPKKRTILMEKVAQGTQGKMAMNRLTSGVSTVAGFAELAKPKQKQAKGQFERMARMPRNQLLDMLFSLYTERAYWPIRGLRERTQQPEAYLKDVLQEIASLHRSGEHNGMWELKPEFRAGAKSEATEQLYKMEGGDTSMYDQQEDEEEEEEDDDMEEVS